MIPDQQFTQPPSRYTEATLIRSMEEQGIGRPSTYAPTLSTITSHGYVIKEGKYLKPTPLGETVTSMMKDNFSDIVDLKFTSQMEKNLDEIENGNENWKDVISRFYSGFNDEMKAAEDNLEGKRIKVPDELSDEFCEVCGRQMVYRMGRFGRFLACPGFPDCTFTKPITVEMPGKCPKCGSKILKKTSKNGHVYYACERGKDCGFMTWSVPTAEFCPSCGKTLFKPNGRGPLKSFCINEQCEKFVPEEKRSYHKKASGDRKSTAKKTSGTKKSTSKSRKTKKEQ
jgi:DNA topoisomerase-1